MNRYAQINVGGICFAVLETAGSIDKADMVPVAAGVSPLGQRWTGSAWEVIAESEADKAKRDLAQIDAETGMSRAMREVFIAIADKVGADAAHLKAKEAAAGIARGKLK